MHIKKSSAYIIIIILSLISYKVVDTRTLSKDNINYRIQLQSSILKGEINTYNQHGIFTVAAIYVMQKTMYVVFHNSQKAYSYAVQIFNFLVFLIIYFCFYKFLQIHFSEVYSVLGILLLGLSVPLAVSGAWPESDFLNLALYIIGFWMMFRSKDLALPVVFLIGMMNGIQILFLFVFYLIYLYSCGKLSSVKSYVVIASVIVSVLVAAMAAGKIFNMNIFRFENYLMLNVSNAGLILQLWMAEFFILLIMAIKGFRYSSSFFRISLCTLLIFFILFLIFGKMNETGRFLPALLILIPMSLNYFSVKPGFAMPQ